MQKIDSQINRNSNAGDFELSTCGKFNKLKRRINSKNRRRQIKKLTENSDY